MSRALALILTFGAAWSPAPALAQAMDTFGFGSRSAALAGAVTADVEDVSANYYNPAGIVRGAHARGSGLRIMAGTFVAAPMLSINGEDSRVEPIHGLVTGLNVPGNIDTFRFGFGLGLHLPNQRLSRSLAPPRDQPRWEFYESRPHRIYLAANLAIQPWDFLRIGGGIAFQSTSDQDLAIRGVIDFLQPEDASRLEHRVTADLLAIRYPQLGVQVDPIDALSIGLVYRGQVSLGGTLRAAVDANIDLAGIDIPGTFLLESESVSLFLPHQVSLGATVRPTKWVRAMAELTFVHWAAYESPVGSFKADLNLDIPAQLPLEIPIPDIVDQSPVPASFRDRFVPRIGVEVDAHKSHGLTLLGRAGYLYEHSPVPMQRGSINLVDTNRHVLSLGIGIVLDDLEPLLPGELVIDIHGAYAFFPDRLMRKSSLLDPYGDYVAGGGLWNGGLSAEVRFR